MKLPGNYLKFEKMSNLANYGTKLPQFISKESNPVLYWKNR